jgi:hypothetical protein
MATLKGTVFNLLVLLLSTCAPAIPQSGPGLEVNMTRLPGTVLLLSNLQDNYRFYAEERARSWTTRDYKAHTALIDVGNHLTTSS